MITYEIDDLEQIDISLIDSVLLVDLCGSTDGYSSYLIQGYDDEVPTRSSLQIIHSDCNGCAAIMLKEVGAPGLIKWINADSLDEALELYLGIATTSERHERRAYWRSGPDVKVDGGAVPIPGTADEVPATHSSELEAAHLPVLHLGTSEFARRPMRSAGADGATR